MTFKTLSLVLLAATALVACSDSENEPSQGSQSQSGTYHLSGIVEKGPFVRGSAVNVQPLNEAFNAVGTLFSGEITDNAGTFDLGEIKLESQFARVAADGYFFNEVTGVLSNGQLHLVALADLSDRSTVNVNILTHLKSARILKLIKEGKRFGDANAQAQKELLAQFGLQNYEIAAAESTSITEGNDGSGVIIAISSVILNNRSEAEVTEYLAELSRDLADDGAFEADNLRQINSDSEAIKTSLGAISDNIVNRYADLGRTVSVPDLRLFFDWDGDGIAGNEMSDNPIISLSQTTVNFGKDGGEATITVNANFKISLEPFGESLTTDDVSSGSGFFSSGEPLSVSATLDGSRLTIKGAPNKSSKSRSTVINLYNILDEVVASIEVNFEGDPSHQLELSTLGIDATKAILSSLTDAHRGYYMLSHDYCYAPTHIIEPNNYQLEELYRGFFNSISRVNNTSKALAEAGYGDYAKLIQTYNAIAYTEMMELWGDVPLVKFTDDAMLNPHMPRTRKQEIRDYFITTLNDALRVASDEKAPGNGEPDTSIPSRSTDSAARLANQCFFLSKDILHLALGDLYLQDGRYGEAYAMYDAAIKNYSMCASLEYSRTSPEHIFSPGVIASGQSRISLKSPQISLTISVYPLYFLSDIRLRMAECKLKLGDQAAAQAIVADIKQHHPEFAEAAGTTLEQIDLIHRWWWNPAYLGFLDRSGFGMSKYGFESHQLLLPLPLQQLALNPNLSQNPGY